MTQIDRPHVFPREAWVLILAGLVWLWSGPSYGVLGFLASALPGSLLLATGVSMLLMPGDRRIAYFAAAGGVVGLLAALLAFVFGGFAAGLLRGALSLASFVAAGSHAVRIEPETEGVPAPEHSLTLAARVAVDEAILATTVLSSTIPGPPVLARIREEIDEARSQFNQAGWLEKPAEYHRPPPPLADADLTRSSERHRGLACEHISFESGYAPAAHEPGAERWRGYTRNRTAHGWVVRGDPAKPWLVCVHGYRLGYPAIDFSAFGVEGVVGRHGLNVLLPALPLHGPRTVGKRSGDGFLSADVLDTVHAEAHAMWDLRRMLGWIRAQGAPAVGLYGQSLGGYTASLLSCLEDDLACVIAGIPVIDISRLFARHTPELQRLEAELSGVEEQHMEEILRLISPLAMECRVPKPGRSVFAAVADRLATPDHARDLWRHWDEPALTWYQGGHMTFGGRPEVKQHLQTAFRGLLLAGT